MREHRHRLSSPRLRGEDGFTMVEIMVAIVLLVIGVLAMLVIVQGGLTSTSRTTAREQATNLARDLVERSRQVPYASTTLTAAPAALAAALPEAPAVSGGTFVVRRRNIDYTVTVTACSIDSPSDGAGVGNATFCDAPSNSTGPTVSPTGSGLALGPNVLGIPVSLAVGGSLVSTVCNALGTNTTILNAVSGSASTLLSLAGNGATLTACPAASGGQMAFDTRPDDLRRIRIKVDWTQASQPYSLTQTTLLTTPG